MKLVNDLMLKFYEVRFDYYDRKEKRLNEEAYQLWRDGEDYQKIEACRNKAWNKIMDMFEKCYYWSGAAKNEEEFTMHRRDGFVYKIWSKDGAPK